MKILNHFCSDNERNKRVVMVGVAIIVLVLSVLSFSPLRLNTDTIRLFAMALPAACGGAYGTDQFPPFYPHLLCMLMKCGWCNNAVLIGLNFLSLAISMLVVYKINDRCGLSWTLNLIVVVSVLLNWVVAKHTMLPQTDIIVLPFFWGSVLSVLQYRDSSTWGRKLTWLGVSILLACIAVSIRIASVALFGLIAVAATGLTFENLKTILRKKLFWVSIGIGIVTISLGTILAMRYTEFAADGGYYSMFRDFMTRGSGAVLSMTGVHLYDLTQLVLNAPARFLPSCTEIFCEGIVAFLIILSMVFLFRKDKLEWFLFVITLGYGLEIFLWPCVDPRFFLPILPFVLLFVIRFLVLLCQKQKKIVAAVVLIYSTLGVLSWGKFAYEWTLGKDFYRHTASPELIPAYKNALKDINDVPLSEHTQALFILKKFDLRYAQENLPLTEHTHFNAKVPQK